jgi:hypothetical protein
MDSELSPGPGCQTSADVNVAEKDFTTLGWCTRQVHRLQRIFTPETLHYLSTLNRRGYRPNNHDACARNSNCIANSVNLSEYPTAHTQTCSGSCLFISVDYNAVVDIIRAGGVPIVSIHVDPASSAEEPTLHLRVTPRKVSTRYTVLSHVWFDGLGNPSANALPTCQVQRLYKQLLSLPRDYESGVFNIGSLEVDWSRQSFVRFPRTQPPLFWIDTLCIPVGDEHKDLRRIAINQMASIYAAAVQELVLDAELMQCEAGTGAALQILARVTCSAWMTRSWTLQEGVLARECVFQFKDRAVDPIHEWCLYGVRPSKTVTAPAISFPNPTDEVEWAVYKELYNFLWDTLHQDWKSRYRRDPPIPAADRAHNGVLINSGGIRESYAAGKIHTLPPVQGLSKRGKNGLDEKDHFTMHLREEHRLKQLVDTWNELAHRSTTVPDDLHVIIANLLDFNADRVMEIPTREERMRAMILSFESLPASLFWNTGPKLDTGECSSNNLWIPIEPSKSELFLTPVMEIADQWLELTLQTKTTENTPTARAFLLHKNEVDFSYPSVFLCSGLSDLMYRVVLCDTHKAATHSSSSELSYYLIIETSLPASTGRLTMTRGALFQRIPSQTADEQSQLRLRYCCPITLQAHSVSLEPDERHTIAEPVAPNTSIAIKYGNFPYPPPTIFKHQP